MSHSQESDGKRDDEPDLTSGFTTDLTPPKSAQRIDYQPFVSGLEGSNNPAQVAEQRYDSYMERAAAGSRKELPLSSPPDKGQGPTS